MKRAITFTAGFALERDGDSYRMDHPVPVSEHLQLAVVWSDAVIERNDEASRIFWAAEL